MNVDPFRSVFFLFILLNSLLFCANLTAAIGVSPSEHTVIYKPDSSFNLAFTGLNRKDADSAIKLFSGGSLNIVLPVQSAILPAHGEQKFEAFLDINKTFEPGTYSSLIYLEETTQPERFLEQGTSVTAHEAVAMRVNLKVPYPGRYLEVEFDEIKPLKVGEVAYFTVLAHNYGGVELLNLKGKVEIYGPNGTKIAALDTSVIDSLPPLETKQLRAYWITSGDLTPGPYEARISVDYGGEKPAEAKKAFQVGDIFLDIVGVSATNTYPGSVAKFSVIVKSEWMESIRDVYAEVFVYGPSKDLIGQAKSSSAVFEPLGTSTLFAFWEVPADLPDNKGYSAKIIVHYADKAAERTINFLLGKEAHVEEPVKTSASVYLAVIALLAVLIVAVIVLIGLQLRRNRKQ